MFGFEQDIAFYWLLTALFFIAVIIQPWTTRAKFILIPVMLWVVYLSAAHEQKQLITPIHSLPPYEVNYVYNGIKLSTDAENKFVITLWLTKMDDETESIFYFPMEGNAEFVEDLKVKDVGSAFKLTKAPSRPEGGVDSVDDQSSYEMDNIPNTANLPKK